MDAIQHASFRIRRPADILRQADARRSTPQDHASFPGLRSSSSSASQLRHFLLAAVLLFHGKFGATDDCVREALEAAGVMMSPSPARLGEMMEGRLREAGLLG